MYHNRGDSTFAGESAEYGDFSGLDDLWTERPEVVSGMEQIYEKWVHDFAVDGFRIDTVKNVDLDFWTQWATALDAYAKKRGRPDFFMFGETYSADPAVTSPYVTRGRLDATLDFPFQDAARQYASQGAPATKLAALFARRLPLHHRQGQRLRAGHLPRQPRHGPHRHLPQAGPPGGDRRRTAPA